MKDSAEVVKFMALFVRLRDICDNSPEELLQSAMDDDGLVKICKDLDTIAYMLRLDEFYGDELFASPVDPKFIHEYRDYQFRFMEIVGKIANSFRVGSKILFLDAGRRSYRVPNGVVEFSADQWDKHDAKARDQSEMMREALHFIDWNAETLLEVDPDAREYVDTVRDGRHIVIRLLRQLGRSPNGVLRRRSLAPFVLVPRQIAAKYGVSSKRNLLSTLEEAQRAFVLGLFNACWALLRSLLESALRDHYDSDGPTLEDLIRNARNLPKTITKAQLHDLRRRSNAVLHSDNGYSDDQKTPKPVMLEKEILEAMFLIRELIEGFPGHLSRGPN